MVYLFFLKKEIEHSYIQILFLILFLIATKSIPLLLYDLNYLINNGIYNILRSVLENNENIDY